MLRYFKLSNKESAKSVADAQNVCMRLHQTATQNKIILMQRNQLFRGQR
jgi:hypothetical protein